MHTSIEPTLPSFTEFFFESHKATRITFNLTSNEVDRVFTELSKLGTANKTLDVARPPNLLGYFYRVFFSVTESHAAPKIDPLIIDVSNVIFFFLPLKRLK